MADEIREIIRSFNYSFHGILRAKLHNFIKRNVWRYLLVSLALAFSFSVFFQQPFTNCFLLVFGISILLSMAVMIISSYFLYLKKRKDSMDITFKESQIIILRNYSGEIENKNWDWIKKVEADKYTYYFIVDGWPSNYIMISKLKLTPDENLTLRKWLQKNNKIKN